MNYTPQGVCSSKIEFEVDNGIISQCKFTGGCSGNTQGVARLVEGMPVQAAIDKLSGIKCGFRPTSCPDQLAKALQKYLDQN